MNETLSIQQANKMLSEIDDEIGRASDDINQYSNEFVEEISRVWEDKNATEFARNFGTSIEEVVSNLEKNKTTLLQTIVEIATHYAMVGGISERPNIISRKLMGNVNPSVVKEFFADGNGDDFGFKNVDQGATQVMDIYDQYKSKMDHRAVDLGNRINGIQAFGNTAITMELKKSANNIVQIVKENLAQVGTKVQNAVDETAKAYKNAGTSAADAVSGVGAGAAAGAVEGAEAGATGEGQDIAKHPFPTDLIGIPERPPVLLYGVLPGPGITGLPDGGIIGGGEGPGGKIIPDRPPVLLYGVLPNPENFPDITKLGDN